MPRVKRVRFREGEEVGSDDVFEAAHCSPGHSIGLSPSTRGGGRRFPKGFTEGINVPYGSHASLPILGAVENMKLHPTQRGGFTLRSFRGDGEVFGLVALAVVVLALSGGATATGVVAFFIGH